MNISTQALIVAFRLNLLRRPLMTATTAEECLDVNRQQLNALIETGKLAWVWDFSINQRHIPEVRILSACVVEQLSGPVPQIGRTRDLQLPEVINLVLPVRREKLRSAEMQRWWHVSADWFRNMRRAGQIQCVPEQLPATGPNASPHFTRASLVKFFEKRRMT